MSDENKQDSTDFDNVSNNFGNVSNNFGNVSNDFGNVSKEDYEELFNAIEETDTDRRNSGEQTAMTFAVAAESESSLDSGTYTRVVHHTIDNTSYGCTQ